MRIKKLSSFGAALLLSLSSILALNAPKVFAAVKTWDGGGSDNNFSTAANWNGDAVPTNGDSLVFPTSVDADTTTGDDRMLTNDMTLSVAGISVTGSYGANDFDYYKISGNAITTTGNVLGNDADTSSPALTLEIALTASGTVTIQSVSSTSSLAIGSNTVTLKGSTFQGGLTGSGSMIVDGYPGGSGGGCSPTATASPFAGNSSSFTGSLKVQSDGSLVATKATTDPVHGASSITKESDGFLFFNLDNGQDMSLTAPITFKGGTVYAAQLVDSDCNDPSSTKTVTLSGSVTFTQETTFNLSNANIVFSGSITGKDFVKVAGGGTGTVTFPDGSTAKSDLKVWTIDSTADCSNYNAWSNNKTVVNVDCSSTIAGATFRGILGGTGKVGAVTFASGGKLAPGLSPGCLSTGNLTFVSGSSYEFEVGGTTACTGYDQTQVTGTVTLGNGTLSTLLYNGFKPAKGQIYKIIDNDAADAVSGTFNALPEGATFTVSGNVLKISYVGGDGNDVVLTVISAATPNTGFAFIKNNPLITLIVTVIATAGLVIISRRSRTVAHKR